jgi:hypothetical protein
MGKVLELRPNLDWLGDLGEALLTASTAVCPRDIAAVLVSQQRQLRAAAAEAKTKVAEAGQLVQRLADLTRFTELRESELKQLRAASAAHGAELRDAQGTIARLTSSMAGMQAHLEMLSRAALNAAVGDEAPRGSPSPAHASAAARAVHARWDELRRAAASDLSEPFVGQKGRLQARTPSPARFGSPAPDGAHSPVAGAAATRAPPSRASSTRPLPKASHLL